MLSSPKIFRCKYPGCNSTYQRKEHLNRHMARHNQGERCSCPHCDSNLARRHRSFTPPHPELSSQETVQDERTTETLFNTDLVGLVPGTSRWIAQDYIDIYFREFHPIWPFLHRGTFDLSKEPCVLLQSMVMIGLWIQGDERSRNTAMAFHHKLLPAIEAQRSQWFVSQITPRSNSWPMATYQSILLQLIFAVFVAQNETKINLNFRFQLPDSKYELLTSLVETCRRLGLFYYPNMLMQHPSSAPLALIWLSVEEVKRFGLALYKLCGLCTGGKTSSTASPDNREDAILQDELLNIKDLEFCLPDSDNMWNASNDAVPDSIRNFASNQISRDNRDSESWISQKSGQLFDANVAFDWL
ncbi:hypothetical protein N7456_009446 [Penicillium angulare]|uniref:C2H2-type domain-containing protein n=1 Tax=Penicillium angulare TaxID=116970 RepID=A0A9W9K5K3_9EURO|nr:hypothetical protein N7456_009446 [Penicillium angulare]